MKHAITLKISAFATLALITTFATIEGAAAQSARYCDRQARDYASRNTNTGENAVRGGIGGAIGGAVIGGILGGGKGIGRGAAIGAGVGALGGAAQGNSTWNRHYNYAYRRCMNSSKARVPVRRAAGPKPWTPEWYDYCYNKYRSFNANTGYYRTYSGKLRFCR